MFLRFGRADGAHRRQDVLESDLGIPRDALDTADQVAIVQYGSEARLVIEHTPASQAGRTW